MTDPDDILDRRLRAEAERTGRSVDVVRAALLRRGLDALEADRHAGATAADIVLVTAGNTEQRELRQAAKSLGLEFAAQRGRAGNYYRLGDVGTNRVVAMQVEMGAFSPTGAAARCIHARAETQATTIVLIGTAFGIDPVRQKIGDVIVSESVFLYDDRRIVDANPVEESDKKYKVSHPESQKFASGTWLDQLRQLDLAYRQNGNATQIEVGVILSGGARIESAAYRDELVQSLPAMDSPIVGGEMEGMGAISAALSTDADEPGWMIVKGISDFADASSRANIKAARAAAARASAMAVLRMLQLPPRSV